MKQTVVLYPGAGVGHVNPMAELAKVFVSHGYDVTMVIVPPPFKSSALGTSLLGSAARRPMIVAAAGVARSAVTASRTREMAREFVTANGAAFSDALFLSYLGLDPSPRRVSSCTVRLGLRHPCDMLTTTGSGLTTRSQRAHVCNRHAT